MEEGASYGSEFTKTYSILMWNYYYISLTTFVNKKLTVDKDRVITSKLTGNHQVLPLFSTEYSTEESGRFKEQEANVGLRDG